MAEPSSRRSSYARLLDHAIRALAICDHSEQELRRKLVTPVMSKDGPGALDITPEESEQVAVWRIENHYLDDYRFVGQLTASRGHRGYDPMHIRQKLSQKEIAHQGIEQAMRGCDIDWVNPAKRQAQREYGEPLPSVLTEKAKVQRFLLYRGYLMEGIQGIRRNFAD